MIDSHSRRRLQTFSFVSACTTKVVLGYQMPVALLLMDNREDLQFILTASLDVVELRRKWTILKTLFSNLNEKFIEQITKFKMS